MRKTLVWLTISFLYALQFVNNPVFLNKPFREKHKNTVLNSKFICMCIYIHMEQMHYSGAQFGWGSFVGAIALRLCQTGVSNAPSSLKHGFCHVNRWRHIRKPRRTIVCQGGQAPPWPPPKRKLRTATIKKKNKTYL